MMQPEQEKKKGILDRLPKLGRVSQLILLIGGFLVIFIPLWTVNQQQSKEQADLNATLANVQKMLTVEQTPKAQFEAELAQVTAEIETAKAVLPSANKAPEILDSLLELAELNDINITQTQVAASKSAGAIGPVLTITIGLRGQMSKFQNFLLALDDKLPTSHIKQLSFTVAAGEEAEDTASVTLDVFCY